MVERPTAALRVGDSIPARNKYLYDQHIFFPGLAVCVCEFSMFANAPMIQELYKLNVNNLGMSFKQNLILKNVKYVL